MLGFRLRGDGFSIELNKLDMCVKVYTRSVGLCLVVMIKRINLEFLHSSFVLSLKGLGNGSW